MRSVSKVHDGKGEADILKEDHFYENNKALFDFMMEKKKLHWEIFKGIEQKAVNLVLFSGVMIGLNLNLINSFPELDSAITINIKDIGISYLFIPMSFIFIFLAIFFGMKVIYNSFFLDTFTETGFIKEESEKHYIQHSKGYYHYKNNNKDNNNYLKFVEDELTDEIRLFKERNTSNSIDLKLGYFFFCFGSLIILPTVFSVY